MSALRRVIVGDGGLGAALWLVLTFGLGLTLVVSGALGLTESFRSEPTALPCEELGCDTGHARWWTVSGCRLDLPSARPEDGGRWLAPLVATPATVPTCGLDAGPPVVRELREPELIALAARLQADPDAGLDASARALLTPARLEGHLVRRDDVLVLERGKPTPDGRSLLAFFLGTALLVWGLMPLGRRWLLARER